MGKMPGHGNKLKERHWKGWRATVGAHIALQPGNRGTGFGTDVSCDTAGQWTGPVPHTVVCP